MSFLTTNTITSKNLTHSLLNGTTYALQASGDFNGDGKLDLLLRNSNRGTIRKVNLAIHSGYFILNYSDILGTAPLTFSAQ